MFPSRCCGQTHHSCLWGVEFSGVYCMCSGTDQTPARSSSTLVFHRISKTAARRPAHERGMAAPSARLSTPSTSTTTGNLPESIRFGRAPSYGEIEKHYVILHDGAVTYYYFFVMGMKGESVNRALHVAFQTSGWLHLEAFASPTVFAAWTSAAGSASAIVAAQNIPWLPKFHTQSID